MYCGERVSLAEVYRVELRRWLDARGTALSMFRPTRCRADYARWRLQAGRAHGRRWRRDATWWSSSGWRQHDLDRRCRSGRPLALLSTVSHCERVPGERIRLASPTHDGAYEDYQQLQVLKQPLAGVYLSFFLMLTLMILIGSTWMGLYLAKRITRPIQLPGDSGPGDRRRPPRSSRGARNAG